MKKINHKEELRDELSRYAPALLDEQLKSQPFTPPGNFFEKLPDTILRRINDENINQPASERKGRLIPLGYRWQRIAATLIVLIAVSLAVYMKIFQSTPASIPADIDSIALNLYIDENLDDFNESMIREMIAGNQIDFAVDPGTLDLDDLQHDENILNEIDEQTIKEVML